MIGDRAAKNRISVPCDSLTQYTFDKLMSVVAQAELNDRGNLTLDCSTLQFVDPFGMIGLILLARRPELRGIPVTFYLPEGRVRSYLGRAGFFQATLPYAEFDPPIDHAWLAQMELYQGGADSLLETTLLPDADAIPFVLERVDAALRGQLSYREHDVFDICIVLSEICHNVFDHNQGGCVCYVAMQSYTSRRGDRFLQVSVGDDGFGIPTTLRGSPECTDLIHDWQIIVKSFDNQVSRFDDLTRGNGLYHLIALVLKHAGTVTVRSGMGKVYVRGDEKRGMSFQVPQLDGTQFAITFPAQ